MRFTDHLSYFRERAGLTKTDLAEKINVSPTYVMHVENGKRPPPTIGKCREIAQVLGLAKAETQSLIDSAMEERLSDEALLWLSERDKKYERARAVCTEEILEALADPVAVKALLAAHKTSDEVKRAVADVIEHMSNISKEKRREILKLCHE